MPPFPFGWEMAWGGAQRRLLFRVAHLEGAPGLPHTPSLLRCPPISHDLCFLRFGGCDSGMLGYWGGEEVGDMSCPNHCRCRSDVSVQDSENKGQRITASPKPSVWNEDEQFRPRLKCRRGGRTFRRKAGDLPPPGWGGRLGPGRLKGARQPKQSPHSKFECVLHYR